MGIFLRNLSGNFYRPGKAGLVCLNLSGTQLAPGHGFLQRGIGYGFICDRCFRLTDALVILLLGMEGFQLTHLTPRDGFLNEGIGNFCLCDRNLRFTNTLGILCLVIERIQRI